MSAVPRFTLDHDASTRSRSACNHLPMIPAIRRLHLIVGLAGIVAFLATGAYMDRVHGHLRGYDETTRLLYRSTHIYLLLAAVTNLGLGLYLSPASARWRRVLQAIGSILLLVAPWLFLAGFCTEPYLSELQRPWTRPAVYGSFAGALLHLAAAVGTRRTISRLEDEVRREM